MFPRPDHREVLKACLWGGAVGDAVGLPYEGLSTRRAQKFARLPLRHRFVCGRGMVSDDTDHSVFVAQALCRSGGGAERFRVALAWRLRCWLLCLPAGIGMATLKSIIRLWLGLRPSGVFSAGNGPAMRSAVLGAYFRDDPTSRRAHVEASTLLTHSDPLAFCGAQAVAEVAARIAAGTWSQRPVTGELTTVLRAAGPQPLWQNAVDAIAACCESGQPLTLAAERFGNRRGVSGFVLHSVPFALVAWHHHFGDYRATVEAITQAGGDVDTIAAIAGALAAMSVGTDHLPPDWRDGMIDWPHSLLYLERLAAALVSGNAQAANGFSPWLFPRGIVFTTLVLAHGFRRLLPPY